MRVISYPSHASRAVPRARPFLLLFLLSCFAACRQERAPQPRGAVPEPRQMAWHEMEYYAFVHFNMNTFTGKEWGYGDESPALFNPSNLDCRQWARIARDAGMKGIIITAKHHDGFCLWPTRYSEHSVKNSPWRGGRGDLIGELAEACAEFGLKMGVYLSPWDRNHPQYGGPEYIDYFRNQLRELLAEYGEIFEVWFDGANGGDGYYGGARETRNVDRQSYYDWETTFALVRELQPNAVIFSDGGPDARWVGNEQGYAGATNWCALDREEFFPGTPRYAELQLGHRDGTHWVPAEVDVSIRPGWYYHKEEDDQVKSPEHLERIYYHSVGRNANLLLNLPVDRRGLIHERDSAALMGLRQRLDATFTRNLASEAEASSQNSYSPGYAARHLLDGDTSTFWAAAARPKPEIVLEWDEPVAFNVIALQEYLPMGQRIDSLTVEAWLDDRWAPIAAATTIGYKRLLLTPHTTTRRLRLRVESALAPPALSAISVYHRPHDNYLLEAREDFERRMGWWRDAKYGMFVHWGPYAVPAGFYRGEEVSGVAEWIMHSANIPIVEYEGFAGRFNPIDFDAGEWARLAKRSGMRYLVITAKHHDGFCLWDSPSTNYDIVDFTPFKRDVLQELKTACDAEGIPLGLYYSIMDWHHPDARGARFTAYRDNYLKPQLRELIEGYDPAILWFDGEWIEEWNEAQGKDLYHYVRSLKPGILVNNRIGKGRQGMQGMNREGEYVGDFGTPEQEVLAAGGLGVDWESCMTINDSWGYKANDFNWKTATTLLHHLVDITAKGGNFLLNVGPDARGFIPRGSVERLEQVGAWLRVNGEGIYQTRPWGVYRQGERLRYTARGEQAYAIFMGAPEELPALRYVRPRPGSPAHLLGYDQPLDWTFDPWEGLTARLPAMRNFEADLPLALRFTGELPAAAQPPEFHNASGAAVQGGIFTHYAEVMIVSATPGASIHYTLDGGAPTRASPRYRAPLRLEQDVLLRAVAVKKGLVNSPVAQADFRRAAYNGLTLRHPYANQYTGGGPFALVDGKEGSVNFKDGRWQGFEGVEFSAVVDLGESRFISSASVNFLQDLGVWIFPPLTVEFAVSDDGESFQAFAFFELETPRAQHSPMIHTFSKTISEGEEAPSGRYVRFEGKNIGVCPSWHAGAGGKAWLFVDEIRVD